MNIVHVVSVWFYDGFSQEIPSGVGQVEVEITYVYGGFPSRQIEYLASQFGLIHRIRGDNVSNKPMITRMHSSMMRTARF